MIICFFFFNCCNRLLMVIWSIKLYLTYCTIKKRFSFPLRTFWDVIYADEDSKNKIFKFQLTSPGRNTKRSVDQNHLKKKKCCHRIITVVMWYFSGIKSLFRDRQVDFVSVRARHRKAFLELITQIMIRMFYYYHKLNRKIKANFHQRRLQIICVLWEKNDSLYSVENFSAL